MSGAVALAAALTAMSASQHAARTTAMLANQNKPKIEKKLEKPVEPPTEAGTLYVSNGDGTITSLSGGGLSGTASLENSKVKCKPISVPAGDGCNTCSSELCTDGEKQWETGSMWCTAMACTHHFNEKTYNPDDWKNH